MFDRSFVFQPQDNQHQRWCEEALELQVFGIGNDLHNRVPQSIFEIREKSLYQPILSGDAFLDEDNDNHQAFAIAGWNMAGTQETEYGL